jgi:hypothetical protein
VFTIVYRVRCEVLFRLGIVSFDHIVAAIQIPLSPIHREFV